MEHIFEIILNWHLKFQKQLREISTWHHRNNVPKHNLMTSTVLYGQSRLSIVHRLCQIQIKITCLLRTIDQCLGRHSVNVFLVL